MGGTRALLAFSWRSKSWAEVYEKEKSGSMAARFQKLGAPTTALPRRLVTGRAKKPRKKTVPRTELVTLALVALLRLAAAGPLGPSTEAAAASSSTDSDQMLAKALRISASDAKSLLSLVTAATLATQSTSPRVAVKYTLYEADTGCSNARMLKNKEYWMEHAWRSRPGLDETFWVIRRSRIGPFEGLIVDPATLPRLLDANEDGRGGERGGAMEAVDVPR